MKNILIFAINVYKNEVKHQNWKHENIWLSYILPIFWQICLPSKGHFLTLTNLHSCRWKFACDIDVELSCIMVCCVKVLLFPSANRLIAFWLVQYHHSKYCLEILNNLFSNRSNVTVKSPLSVGRIKIFCISIMCIMQFINTVWKRHSLKICRKIVNNQLIDFCSGFSRSAASWKAETHVFLQYCFFSGVWRADITWDCCLMLQNSKRSAVQTCKVSRNYVLRLCLLQCPLHQKICANSDIPVYFICKISIGTVSTPRVIWVYNFSEAATKTSL